MTIDIKAAVKTLQRAVARLVVHHPDIARLEELSDALERAHVGVLREEIPGKLVFEPDGAGQRVIVIEVER